jgi:hypothetical protein
MARMNIIPHRQLVLVIWGKELKINKPFSVKGHITKREFKTL